MAHVDAIEHQARRPDHRHHRHDGDGLVPTSRRTVQLDGVQLGTIELHQTSSAVNDQVCVLLDGSMARRGGRQNTVNTGIQQTWYCSAPGTAVMVKSRPSMATGVRVQSPST
ncbi:hypothetical protein D9M69_527180 [compost metagenome]